MLLKLLNNKAKTVKEDLVNHSKPKRALMHAAARPRAIHKSCGHCFQRSCRLKLDGTGEFFTIERTDQNK